MLSDDQIKQLKSENELLLIQLQDVNEMIKLREEELRLLRKTSSQAVSLQSRLDANLVEFEQMQDHISKQQRLTERASKRAATLEDEILQSIQMETEFYNIKDQFTSAKAALADMNYEMDQTASLHKQIATLTSKISFLESNLEIARLDNHFLKEELEIFRKEQEAKPGAGRNSF